jgi:hypothetical protein
MYFTPVPDLFLLYDIHDIYVNHFSKNFCLAFAAKMLKKTNINFWPGRGSGTKSEYLSLPVAKDVRIIKKEKRMQCKKVAEEDVKKLYESK